MSKSKPVKVGGRVEELTMEFPNAANPSESIGGPPTDPNASVTFKPARDVMKKEIPQDQFEDYSVDGKKVYSKNIRTGEYVWYDGEGKVVEGYTLQNLNLQYGPYPDVDDLGGKKDGPLQTRLVDDNNNSPGHPNYTDKPWAISERQNYESGQAMTRTIPLKFAGIVKTLRGETPDADKESGSIENKEVKEEGSI
jgi:hypothetical protein